MKLWTIGAIILFIGSACLLIYLVHYFAALPPEAYQSDSATDTQNLNTPNSNTPNLNTQNSNTQTLIPIIPIIPIAEPMAPENKYESVKSQMVDIVQQVNPQKRYILLQASEDYPLARAKRYYTSQTVPDPNDSSRKLTTTITGSLADYKTEVVAPDMIPWSFRVFTEPGIGRIQWCVWTQARSNPNFVIRQVSDCQQATQLGELLVYTFWAPDQLAPDLTWVRVERNDSDPNQTRYRLRPANQPLESNWIPQDKILTPIRR